MRASKVRVVAPSGGQGAKIKKAEEQGISYIGSKTPFRSNKENGKLFMPYKRTILLYSVILCRKSR